MPEYRRILLDGACVQVRREGGDLVAGDGRRVAASDAVHLPPVVPSKIVAVHLNHHSRVPPAEAGGYIAGYTIANDFGLHDFRDTDAGSMLRVKGSDTMHYLVADIARTITLLPGDVLLSGTPANSRPVEPGDVVEVAVNGLGRLASHIVAGPVGAAAGFGAQPSQSEEVISTAFGGDWEFRGIRPPART